MVHQAKGDPKQVSNKLPLLQVMPWGKLVVLRSSRRPIFEEIGPETDLANFILVHLTNPYSVIMADLQHNGYTVEV